MKTAAKIFIRILLTISFLHGCGYQNPYVKNIERGEPPATLFMAVWANQTNELGFENLIFQKTIDWLQQSRHLRLTADKAQADYVLAGTIVSVDFPATAFSTYDVASTLQASATTTYKLTDQTTGKTIWQYDTLRETSYSAGSDAVQSQSNKKGALTTIADELGEQIYLSITDTLAGKQKADRPNEPQ